MSADTGSENEVKDWIPTKRQLPERGQKVDWISPSGHLESGGTFHGAWVWSAAGSDSYIYYTPVFWRPAKK